MKERLTGAIILVALIVLLVPELLTGPVRKKPAPTASAPALGTPAVRAQPPLRTYTMTLTPGAPAREGLATPPAQAAPAEANPSGQAADSGTGPQHSAGPALEAPEATEAQDSQPRTEAGSSLQAAKTPAHPAVRESRAAGSSGGWVVQLGSFASRQNADRLAHSLTRRGFRMSVSPARAGSRVLWRVRAGPVRDRASAGRLATRLRSLGHRGELLPVR